jgi:hypothetical protein
MKDLTFENGDLLADWIEGNNVISISVKRRLGTLPLTYARAIKTSEGTKVIDTTFGSNLRQYLSYPDRELNNIDFADVVEESLSSDPDITVKSVEVAGNNIKVLFKSSTANNETLATFL